MKDELVRVLKAAVDACEFTVEIFGDGIVPDTLPAPAAAVNAIHEGRTRPKLTLRRVEISDRNEKTIDALEEKFGVWLNDFIDDEGCIRNGLAHAVGGLVRPPVREYAEGLVCAAAALGAQRTIEIVGEWREGVPAVLHEYIVLNISSPANVDQPVFEVPGLRLEALPRSSAQFPPHLDRIVASWWGFQSAHLLGKFLVTLDLEAKTLLRQDDPIPQSPSRLVEHGNDFPGIFGLDFFSSLSLACNQDIREIVRWCEPHELRRFEPLLMGTFASLGEPMLPIVETTIDQGHFAMTRRLCGQFRRFKGRLNEHRLRTAISRWSTSKRALYSQRHGWFDQFIDLRIALESLYGSGGGELRFKVSSCGANHLAEDFDERKHYRDLLKKVYDVASKVIHAGNISSSDANTDTLCKGQDACRDAILKCLADGKMPDQDQLLLG